ncbi:MAG: transposase [Myxococcales bacterium]|nr:transposase [Myxococcales bacterium]
MRGANSQRPKLLTPQSSEAIAIIRKLLAIERELPDFRRLEDPAEREAAFKIIAASRLEKSRPLMEELAQWMREQNCLPKSKLGGSIRYATNS